MSMLSSQADELREAARSIQGNLGRCLYRRKDVDEMQQVSGMLFEAVDTIESLRDRLQELQGAGGGECELAEVDSYSNANEVIHVFECSACGNTCEHVNGSYPRCPHCGRKAVER